MMATYLELVFTQSKHRPSRTRLTALLQSLFCVALPSNLAAIGAGAAPPPRLSATQNARAVPLYEVFELTFHHDQRYANPFFDVSIDVSFTSPTGKKIRVGGFHYGSSTGPNIKARSTQTPRGARKQLEYAFDKQDLWKARLAPCEFGRWTYTYVFANAQKETAQGQGEFECVRARVHKPGFVRPNPENPYRWIFDDGTPYFPIGLQECIGDGDGIGSALAAMSMEGPFRMDRTGRPEPPPGATFKPGPGNNPQNADVYFRNHARAGFNLFRFSQKNCSFELYRDLDQYLVQEGVMTDELIRHARKYGMRVFYGLFGYQPVFNDRPDNAEEMAKVKRFIKYSVDRWGAYVDFWEFLNEQKADAKWYEIMAPYLRSIDPYQHPITTSWERPELPGIEINAPHWYAGIRNTLGSDQETATRAAAWKKFGKPVIVGEQGNHATKEQLQTPGIGGVWDIESAVRMRIRNWTALFNEIAFIFWNTSYAKDGHYMNIWLGPEERQYVHAMQDFARSLDNDVKILPVAVSDPSRVRAYALASSSKAGVYVHHFSDHEAPVTNLAVTLDVPKPAAGYWYLPENAAILARFEARAGRQTFAAPPFAIDLALLITPDGPPDSDRDNQPNDLDPDDDNDGVPDAQDAFPLDPEESSDQDGDRIGDNMDADVDGDGVGDDRNKNGIPDCDEIDFDGGGIDRANAVPWDAFPFDPKEWRDTDGDGIGDNADPDDDGDGWSDAEETKAGTDTLDPLSFPRKAA
ncbi:MAG: DUF5060 domain-containing protein [Verrucomicrobia bacterium]|nr:DUF5060 domain-containing protein [Verrucomicrobiota bacterium]